MLADIVKLVNRILDYIELIYIQNKQRQKEKAIEKILNNPDGAWGDRFGKRLQPAEDRPSDASQ